MADTWQTIEQAAVSLRFSVRTVNRHIVAGKLQSRLSAEGRREVLVNLAEPAPVTQSLTPPSFDASVSAAADAATGTWQPMSDATSPASSPFSQSASPAVSFDPETVLALADNAAEKAELAVTAYQTLARLADTQAREVRRGARLAWAAVAVMAVGITVAVAWATHHVTRASAEIDYLKRESISAADAARQLSAEQGTLRAQLAAAEQSFRSELTGAREQGARAEGKLAAYEQQEQERQTRETLAAAAAAAGPILPSVMTFERTNRIDDLLGAASDNAEASDIESVTASERSTEVRPVDEPARNAATGEAPPPKVEAAKPAAPASRPAVLRRRARAATTRAAASDTSSASTAEER